ncbi:MAG: hypothetical protein K2F64_02515 [Muribaculaceae bacterium]|nr:hypothetical protein [Muribaculaceae bacterium]
MKKEMIIEGDLRVEGWLEAPNIRGFLKGMFLSHSDLEAAYPHPLPGWAALVGTSLPAPVYVSSEGRWVASGGTGGASSFSEGGMISSLVDRETLRREEQFGLMSESMGHAFGWKKISPVWNESQYVAQSNRLTIGEPGFFRSVWINLNPGESLICRCDSGGKAMPIAIEAEDQPEGWWDFPMLGEDLSAGMRDYHYHSERGDRVMISCLGFPEKIMVLRNCHSKIVSRLYAANGSRSSGTRRETGARLDINGRVVAESGYGVSSEISLNGISMLDIQTNIDDPSGDVRAFAVFYDEGGNPVEVHYSGERREGSSEYAAAEARPSDITISRISDANAIAEQSADPVGREGEAIAGTPRLVWHPGGCNKFRMIVPSAAATARFAYTYPRPRTAANPPFRIILDR